MNEKRTHVTLELSDDNYDAIKRRSLPVPATERIRDYVTASRKA